MAEIGAITVRTLLFLAFSLPLLAEDPPLTIEQHKISVCETDSHGNQLCKDGNPELEQLKAQIAAKDAEIAQLREWGQACIVHVQKDMALINGFLGPLEQIPQPAIPTVARPPKPRESKP